MNQRFRKAAPTAYIAVSLAVLTNPIWINKIYAESSAKPAAVTSKPTARFVCPEQFNEKVAARMAKPHKTSEFLDLISEASQTYRRASVDTMERTDEYLKETRRSPDKEKRLLKRARETEKSYLEVIKRTIEAYAVSANSNKEELLSFMRGCLYVDSRSIFSLVRAKLIESILNPRPDQGPPEWVTEKSKFQFQKTESEREKNDRIFNEVTENMKRKERYTPNVPDNSSSSIDSMLDFSKGFKGSKESSGTYKTDKK